MNQEVIGSLMKQMEELKARVSELEAQPTAAQALSDFLYRQSEKARLEREEANKKMYAARRENPYGWM